MKKNILLNYLIFGILDFVLGDPMVFYQPEQVHLSLAAETNGMMVSWSTMNKTNSSVVEYGLMPTSLDQSSFATVRLFDIGPGNTHFEYVYLAQMKNLPYDTLIYYHVGSDMGWSDTFWFRTFPDPSKPWSPSLVLYGDMGNVNAQSLPRLQTEVMKGDYNFVVHAGDFAYNLEFNNGQTGDEFMRQIEPIAAYVPYMTCVGNHEFYNNYSNYKFRFNMPNDPDSENMYFSYDVGPIHFISISTEFYYGTNYGTDQIFNQYNWLENDLKNVNREKTPWILIYGHRPMYCTNSDGDDCTKLNCKLRVGIPEIKAKGLEGLLMQYKVDIAVWAHEHSYERLWPLYNGRIMNGSYEHPYHNPRAPVHITTGTAGCFEKHNAYGKPENITAFRSVDYGYTRLYALNATHLHFQQVSDDKGGEIIDDFWVTKDKPTF